MSQEGPVRVPLTPEQRELVHRISGQHVEAIELEADREEKGGSTLKFRWRLSSATGIPRQDWLPAEETDPPPTSGH